MDGRNKESQQASKDQKLQQQQQQRPGQSRGRLNLKEKGSSLTMPILKQIKGATSTDKSSTSQIRGLMSLDISKITDMNISS